MSCCIRCVDSDEELASSQGSGTSEWKEEKENEEDRAYMKLESRVCPRMSRYTGRFSRGKKFRNGDFIWAKAFAYIWWPGRIEKIKGSSASVSFYGCAKTRWARVSQLRTFEENYAQMVRIVGNKLSNAVALALDDLQRITTLGLACSCRNLAVEGPGFLVDQISESRKEFEPAEMLSFVFDMAVSARVDGAIVRAVRMIEQVSVCRRHLSICQNSEVDESLCPVDLLDFVADMAVCWMIGDATSDSDRLSQLNGHRKFVSVCPNRVYQQIMELGCSFVSEESAGDYHGTSDSSSEGEMVFEMLEETDDFILLDKKEDFVIVEEQVQGCKDICIVNREDSSFLDLDEEYECLQDNQLKRGADCTGSTWENIFMGENFEIPISEISACKKEFPSLLNVVQIADNGTSVEVDEQPINSLFSSQTTDLSEKTADVLIDMFDSSGDTILNGISLDSVEMETMKHQDDNSTNAEHEGTVSARERVSSNNSLLAIVPWVDGLLDVNHSNNCETHFLNETSKISLKMQSSSEVAPIAYPVVTLEDFRSFSSMMITGWKISSRKRKLDRPFYPEISFKLLKGREAHAEALASAANMTEHCTVHSDVEVATERPVSINSKVISNSGNRIVVCTAHSDKINAEKAVFAKVLIKSVSQDDLVPSLNYTHVSNKIMERQYNMRSDGSFFFQNYLNHAKSLKKTELHGPVSSDATKWTRFYASPLVRDDPPLSPLSSSHVKKSLVSNICREEPKTLHMKFPKDFNLPSKEELEKMLVVFGPLECTRTKVSFYTGGAQVVFVDHHDAFSAYRYLQKNNVFGEVSVRFWFGEHEVTRWRGRA